MFDSTPPLILALPFLIPPTTLPWVLHTPLCTSLIACIYNTYPTPRGQDLLLDGRPLACARFFLYIYASPKHTSHLHALEALFLHSFPLP